MSLPREMTTGSSIMPQKRNPDVFELVRGAQATVTGALQETLALTAKLTSGYHRDLQRLKAPLFRSIDLAGDVLAIMAHALPGVRFRAENIVLGPELYAAAEANELVVKEGVTVPRSVSPRRREAQRRQALTTRAPVHDATRAARGRSGRGAIKLGALLAVFVALAGCGQRGPLTLPDSARPIERLDPAAQPGAPPAASGTPSSVAQPAGAPPATHADRARNGRRRLA